MVRRQDDWSRSSVWLRPRTHAGHCLASSASQRDSQAHTRGIGEEQMSKTRPKRCTEPPFAPGDLPWSFWFSFVSSWRSVSLAVRRRAGVGLIPCDLASLRLCVWTPTISTQRRKDAETQGRLGLGRGLRRFPPRSGGAADRRIFCVINLGLPNQITAAKTGKRCGFAGRSRVGLSPRPGVAEFRRYALS